MFFDDPQMLSLGLDEQEHKNYSHNKITYNKLMSKIQAKARQEAKLNYCYYCKKEVSSFCNSHVDHNHEIISLDLSEYSSSFSRAQIGSLGKHNDWYYLCYYKKLNYTVPIAFQGGVVMVCDFEDDVINDIYNMSPDYHTKEIHIAVFPLEQESIIMLFIDARDKRYRKFYKQLNKLPLEEQLSAINYIIFSYSENVYISKSIDESILTNEHFVATCQKSSIATASHPFGNALNAAVAEFSLSKRNEIPNLLSEEFRLA